MNSSITSDTFGLLWGGLGFLAFTYALSRAISFFLRYLRPRCLVQL